MVVRLNLGRISEFEDREPDYKNNPVIQQYFKILLKTTNWLEAYHPCLFSTPSNWSQGEGHLFTDRICVVEGLEAELGRKGFMSPYHDDIMFTDAEREGLREILEQTTLEFLNKSREPGEYWSLDGKPDNKRLLHTFFIYFNESHWEWYMVIGYDDRKTLFSIDYASVVNRLNRREFKEFVKTAMENVEQGRIVEPDGIFTDRNFTKSPLITDYL